MVRDWTRSAIEAARTAALQRHPNVKVPRTLAVKATGLKWQKVSERPAGGIMLNNRSLKEALNKAVLDRATEADGEHSLSRSAHSRDVVVITFTETEWSQFGVDDLRANHFVYSKEANSYFLPVVGGILSLLKRRPSMGNLKRKPSIGDLMRRPSAQGLLNLKARITTIKTATAARKDVADACSATAELSSVTASELANVHGMPDAEIDIESAEAHQATLPQSMPQPDAGDASKLAPGSATEAGSPLPLNASIQPEASAPKEMSTKDVSETSWTHTLKGAVSGSRTVLIMALTSEIKPQIAKRGLPWSAAEKKINKLSIEHLKAAARFPKALVDEIVSEMDHSTLLKALKEAVRPLVQALLWEPVETLIDESFPPSAPLRELQDALHSPEAYAKGAMHGLGRDFLLSTLKAAVKAEVEKRDQPWEPVERLIDQYSLDTAAQMMDRLAEVMRDPEAFAEQSLQAALESKPISLFCSSDQASSLTPVDPSCKCSLLL
jgi:hypothetical protein